VAGLVAVPVAGMPSPADAAGNSLYFANGSDNITVGAGAAIYIDGTITFDSNCQGGTRPGTDDFVYPATDIYIVNAGSASDGSGLTDAGGNGPNTIVGTGSGAFLAELIAVVTPSGSLGEGEYDVVYDTCQDGIVGFEDEIWYDAITVDVPDGQLPPVNDSIRRIKDAAREEYAQWLKTHMGLTALFKFEDALEIASCILAPSPGCLAGVIAMIYDVDSVMAQSSNWIEDQSLKLVMNRAKNYGAIWQDPADPDFDQHTAVVAEDVRVPAAAGAPVPDALSGLVAPLAQEGALADALLHALERYQGAQAAGDEEWALVQARAVRDLSSTLADHLRTSSSVQDLRDAIAGDLADVADRAADGAAVINRIRTTGLTADERRELANRGFDDAAISAVEARFVADGRQVAPTGSMILADLDALLDAQDEMIVALDESATGWDALATQLAARVDAPLPIADAGDAYSAPGGAVTLDASASTTPTGTTITSYEWDTDADGDFDDATGVVPAATLDASGTVAVRVTNSAGYSAVDTAVVVVDGAAAPAITSSTPAPAVTITVGDSQQFGIVAPAAGAIHWSLDGVPAGTGAGFTYAPDADAVGEHVLSAVAAANGREVARTWVISVLLPDVDGDEWTATSDCNDARADVHPGGFERIGNGLDDDCDARTPDAPAGGVTGELWTWGDSTGVGRTPPQSAPSPIRLASFGDDVRYVESRSGGGVVIMNDGTLRTWGTNFYGTLGNGTQGTSYAPVTVQNIGGGGALGGVVQVASDGDTVLALRGDSSVVAFGSNINEQAGDDSGITNRLLPVQVLDENHQPLTGVVQVETGETTSFALMADGTVKVFGVNHCDASIDIHKNPVATTNALYGDQVVQLSSGDGGGAIVRNADGSVLACSSYSPLLGRGPNPGTFAQQTTPMQVSGFGPGSGVIDVAHGMSHAVALTEDGTVWTWGRNLNHVLDVLGIAASATQWTPAQVPLPPGPPVVDIETDYSATTFATRADGSVLVWGANVNYSGGVGNSNYPITGTPQIALGGGAALMVSSSVWNGLAIVRPAAEAGSPVRPIFWVDASVADASFAEADGGSVVVTLSAAAPTDLTVEYSFDGTPGSAVIPAGAASVDVPVAVADDSVDEADEELMFTLTSVSNGVRLDRRNALVTVIDDDSAPTAAIADTTVLEGDTSLTDVAVEVTLSAPSSHDVVVDYSVEGGTAAVGTDVSAAAGTLLVPAGETAGTVHVAVMGDTVLEDDEAFSVVLGDAENATVADGEASVSIVDDEPIVVSVASPDVVEGDAGTTPALFDVTVTQPPSGSVVTLPWAVQAGTAELGADVVAVSGALVLDGDTAGQVAVAVVADEIDEDLAVETFRLGLGEATSSDGRAVVVSDTAPATVTDDDVTEVIVVDAGPALNGTEGAPVALHGTVTGTGGATLWTVDAAGCTIADAAALDTTVTCVDEAAATLTLAAGSISDSAALAVGNVAPSVVVSAPAPGTGAMAGDPVTLVADVADPGTSDVLSCVVGWGDGTPVAPCDIAHTYAAAGTFAVTVTVTDGDGGSTTAGTSVVVTAPAPGWVFDGFYQPVDNLPTVNVVKAGSTVPLKFGLGGDHGLDIFEPGYPASASRTCDGAASDVLEETSTPGAATLTYDPTTGRYHYNWKTQRTWAGTCRVLVLRFADGTEVTAEFRFK